MSQHIHSPSQIKAIETDLRNTIRGEVRFDEGTRALYATDASNYRQVPIGVVIPRDLEDVIQTVSVARQHGAPLLARGGGTSLAGQCCNVAVVMDLSKYVNRVISIDPEKRLAQVDPGLILDDLRDLAEHHRLTFGPDPATHTHCTLGGMIGNNSCGVHSVYSGKTEENVEELEILTYRGMRMQVGKTSEEELHQIIKRGGPQGEIYSKLKRLRDRYADLIRRRYPNIPRRVSGYNLDQLLPENGFHVARALVGTECTCVVVLSATLRLVYSPPFRSLVVLGYPDVAKAADHISQILEFKPLALEGIDDHLVNAMKKKRLHPEKIAMLPEGGGWLFVEFGGESQEEANEHTHDLIDGLKRNSNCPAIKQFDDGQQQKILWKVRESALGATALVPGEPDTWEGWEDSAVSPEKVGDYLRDLRKLMKKYDYRCSLYGHFGQGCVHTRIDFDLITTTGIKKFRAFIEEAADLVISYEGSLSGEHGDGQSRAELLPKMFGPELVEAFREFKNIWDPDNKMNPGKVVNPYRLDENLRLGTGYKPAKTSTHFRFPNDEGNFSNATLRCIGVGECRRMKTGLMCPSYMVTREEKHSTRGRARLLFEMNQGDFLGSGWKDNHVKEALDLCFACKGCKSDCPVEVDMATYKAEFLSHYYQGRLRPRSAYSMGMIYRWSRLASHIPGIVNMLTQSRYLEAIAKKVAGVAKQRRIPRFANQTFRKWFSERSEINSQKPKVILWPDTFNNYFHPDIARAAVSVLEDAGFQVMIPSKSLCCGRPLYDYGMLDLAKKLLREILTTVRKDIEEGTPIIGLEPSCIAVFRDEMPNLFPLDRAAIRLSRQTFLLSEFLQKEVRNYQPVPLKRRAIVHKHCHHHAVMRFDDEEKLLKKLGLDFQILDSGCCGMAGSFGFESDHYDTSILAGERVLLPAVRNAPEDTLIIANGFSCREQIAQCTNRTAFHLVEVLQMTLKSKDSVGS